MEAQVDWGDLFMETDAGGQANGTESCSSLASSSEGRLDSASRAWALLVLGGHPQSFLSLSFSPAPPGLSLSPSLSVAYSTLRNR